MRNLLVGLCLGLLIAVSIAHTEQRPEEISVGTTLQLGMAKEAALSQLTEKGFHVGKVDGAETWTVDQKNDQGLYEMKGSMTFTAARLTSASRTWLGATDGDSAILARNFYFLIKSFEDADNTACTLETENDEGPRFDSKGVLIRCGLRTAKLYTIKYKDHDPATWIEEKLN